MKSLGFEPHAEVTVSPVLLTAGSGVAVLEILNWLAQEALNHRQRLAGGEAGGL